MLVQGGNVESKDEGAPAVEMAGGDLFSSGAIMSVEAAEYFNTSAHFAESALDTFTPTGSDEMQPVILRNRVSRFSATPTGFEWA